MKCKGTDPGSIEDPGLPDNAIPGAKKSNEDRRESRGRGSQAAPAGLNLPQNKPARLAAGAGPKPHPRFASDSLSSSPNSVLFSLFPCVVTPSSIPRHLVLFSVFVG